MVLVEAISTYIGESFQNCWEAAVGMYPSAGRFSTSEAVRCSGAFQPVQGVIQISEDLEFEALDVEMDFGHPRQSELMRLGTNDYSGASGQAVGREPSRPPRAFPEFV